MKCKNLYYHSTVAEQFAKGRNDPLVIAGGFCKKHFPVGMWCYKDDYKHLCPGKGHEAETPASPPVPVETPVDVPIEKPVETHEHKKRGRPRK